MSQEWQQCVKEAIDSIPVVRYKGRDENGKKVEGLDEPGATGVTEDVYFKGTLIIAEKNNGVPVSLCSGVQLQAFILAVSKHSTLKNRFTPEMIKKLIKWAYVYKGPEGEEDKYKDGLPGGLVEMGMAEFVGVDKAEYGDLIQIQGVEFNNEYDDGHAVVFESLAEREGKPVIWSWSSSPSIKGVGRDWHWIYKEKNGISRTWKIARMIE